MGLRDKRHREELILKTNPLYTLIDLLVVIFSLAEVFHASTGILIIYSGITLFKHATFLLTYHLLMPEEIHGHYT